MLVSHEEEVPKRQVRRRTPLFLLNIRAMNISCIAEIHASV